MPEAISGRLLVLVINTHCERKLFTSKNSNDPEKIARRFCTPDNCLVVVLRNNRFLFHLERAPGHASRWYKGRTSICRRLYDWLT
ncbi:MULTISPECIES: type IV pilus biogenesis protein PilI [Enterobacteriaceae]|uniref:PilI type IV pilus biogenesis protein n=1 Tax=Escherichia coli TaxID=562 RepID=A0A773Q6S8_ECOLX|nr:MULTISPECIES: PilI type IV pilus biogenesis protein [Enterobacteriaceae]EAA6351203.1 pilus assembly protein [Salmonella enterica subsp. enterica serovar Saintpaul]EAB4894021.1 pilus assembly protein [Salmonella enterica]EBS1954299.1 pilus assembly protein [Salmonella enterica subsp. enterica serovar Javiana]EBS3504443.1 pilus assembly protein [Salmonella enterica subsp. enterica serovar Richmond]EBV4668772.1 pilus assembly protein [Salmonella enterica subsp. enterica serovar Agona]EBW45325